MVGSNEKIDLGQFTVYESEILCGLFSPELKGKTHKYWCCQVKSLYPRDPASPKALRLTPPSRGNGEEAVLGVKVGGERRSCSNF